jgi:hypothetical protein
MDLTMGSITEEMEMRMGVGTDRHRVQKDSDYTLKDIIKDVHTRKHMDTVIRSLIILPRMLESPIVASLRRIRYLCQLGLCRRQSHRTCGTRLLQLSPLPSPHLRP